jgi:hypothetical protein
MIEPTLSANSWMRGSVPFLNQKKIPVKMRELGVKSEIPVKTALLLVPCVAFFYF